MCVFDINYSHFDLGLTDKNIKQLLKEGFQQLEEVEKLKKNNDILL